MAEESFLERIGIKKADYPVPAHANTIWFSLGGLTVITFAVTIVTGIVLSQFYNPSPDTAHTSVRYINYVPWLRFVRSLHSLSANIGFGLVIVHMIRVLLTHAYRPPRVATYLLGLLLFAISFQLYFSGTVLKWDQEGYEAMAHFTAVNALLGPLGAFFQEDFTLSTSMLARIYALHISIFPMLLILTLVAHALLVKQHGIAPLPSQSESEYQKSLESGSMFYGHVKNLLLYGGILVVFMAIVAAFYTPELLGTPKPGIEVTKPPWPFWIFYPIESAIGVAGILIGSAFVGGMLAVIPVLGLVIRQETILFRLVKFITITGLVVWLGLMVATYFMPIMEHM